jgi:hypothetical protein
LVRGTGPEETDARAGDGGAIIEWLFEEYARDTARRAE